MCVRSITSPRCRHSTEEGTGGKCCSECAAFTAVRGQGKRQRVRLQERLRSKSGGSKIKIGIGDRREAELGGGPNKELGLRKCCGTPMQEAVPHSNSEPAQLKQEHVGAGGATVERTCPCPHLHIPLPGPRKDPSQPALTCWEIHPQQKVRAERQGFTVQRTAPGCHASPTPSPVLGQQRGVQRKSQMFF